MGLLIPEEAVRKQHAIIMANRLKMYVYYTVVNNVIKHRFIASELRK